VTPPFSESTSAHIWTTGVLSGSGWEAPPGGPHRPLGPGARQPQVTTEHAHHRPAGRQACYRMLGSPLARRGFASQPASVRCDSQRSGRRQRRFRDLVAEAPRSVPATVAAALASWPTASRATASFGPLHLINSTSDAWHDTDRRNTSDAALLTHARSGAARTEVSVVSDLMLRGPGAQIAAAAEQLLGMRARRPVPRMLCRRGSCRPWRTCIPGTPCAA
jgi:hypothetical protein